MPKRLPGGRPAKDRRPKKRAPVPQATVPAPADGSSPVLHESVAQPPVEPRAISQRTSPAPVVRQSVLASVRRPGKPTVAPMQTDYSYIAKDLRRIGLLAGVGMAVLVALTFVVR